ncbi:MAG: ABC transporter ATP-binding protein [Spirochaetaceae bacterium]|jgi:putative ABC transport system ATP-binding protein|nr:ABC transporter ATP-binding protein [Spirochaetaceae bacterium]
MEAIMDKQVTREISKGQRLIELKNLYKTYQLPWGKLNAVHDISLELQSGEFLAVVGQSGSGKTTLINLVCGIDSLSSGSIRIGDTQLEQLSQRKLNLWRGSNLGVVFQFFQLLPTLSIMENILLPMNFCNIIPVNQRKDRALALLDRVGILEQANKFPSHLSGGQQQRAAIARSLANDPSIICADEPTGNLDSQTSDKILDLFAELAREGKTILMVTHERDVSTHATREIRLHDGKIVQDRSI